MCPGLEHARSLGLISYDSSAALFLNNAKIKTKGIMYSAVWLTNQLTEKNSFARYGIFRKEVETKENFIKTSPSVWWLWEPEFLSTYEDDKFVYFFFTEYSIEAFSLQYRDNLTDLNSGTMSREELNSRFDLRKVSRVARVCKNDRGMAVSNKLPQLDDVWTSFRKIKMGCRWRSDSSGFETADFNSLTLVKKLDDETLIAVFLVGSEKKPNSVFCSFKLDELRRGLSEPRFWLNRAKYKLEEHADYIDRFDSDFDCDNMPSLTKSQKELDDKYSFLAENTILDAEIVGKCEFVLPYEISSVGVEAKSDGLENEQTIVLGSACGKVIKVDRDGDRYQNLTIIEIENGVGEISQVVFNELSGMVYLATLSSVIQFDLNKVDEKLCMARVTCRGCVRETRCVWNAGMCQLDTHAFKKDSERCSGNDFDLEAFENTTVVLACAIPEFDRNYWLAFDRSSVKWYRNGEVFIDMAESNTELVFRYVRLDQSGFYMCKVGDFYETRIRLVVNALPVISSGVECAENGETQAFNRAFENWKQMIESFITKMNDFEQGCTADN
jgi:hypothetical protein